MIRFFAQWDSIPNGLIDTHRINLTFFLKFRLNLVPVPILHKIRNQFKVSSKQLQGLSLTYSIKKLCFLFIPSFIMFFLCYSIPKPRFLHFYQVIHIHLLFGTCVNHRFPVNHNFSIFNLNLRGNNFFTFWLQQGLFPTFFLLFMPCNVISCVFK